MSKRKTTELVPAEQQGGQMQVQTMPYGQNALAAITMSSEVTQTLASIHIAKTFPRNEAEAANAVERTCQKYSFAKSAMYSLPRGKDKNGKKLYVNGPSIRLAEMVAAVWGNIEYGWREISRHKDEAANGGNGCLVSECEAYCFDKQTNTRRVQAFSVPHLRDKGGKLYELTNQQEVDELCASKAARRVRNCILAIIPSWLVEEAMEHINATLERGDGKESLPERIRSMERQFLKLGVTRAMLEEHLGHPLESCRESDIARMIITYKTIRDGKAEIEEFFKVPQPVDVQAPAFMAPPAEEEDEIPGLSPTQQDELVLSGQAEDTAPQFGTPYGG